VSVRSAPGWADVLEDAGVSPATAGRLIVCLRACELAALELCRLVDRWARGEAVPATAAARSAALRGAAAGAERALHELEEPLERYLLELEAGELEGRSWYGGPGRAEVVDWEPVLRRAGVPAPAASVAQAYLELAVLVRALEGLTASAQLGVPPSRSALWAGLFDLRDNLVAHARDDLRALAAA
jgi:hypothetical protein